MKSSWIRRLMGTLVGRAEASGRSGEKQPRAEEKEGRSEALARKAQARARRAGFWRFYGQRAIDGARALAASGRSRRYAERALFFAAGAAVAFALTYGLSWPGSGTSFSADGGAGMNGPSAPGPADIAASPFMAREPDEQADESAGSGFAAESEERVRAEAVDWASEVGADVSGGGSAGSDRSASGGPGGLEAAAPGGGAGAGSEVRTPVRAPLPSASITSMVWPVSGGELVRHYGWYRHPVFGDWRYASSVVIKPGETGEVQAALAGRVRDVVDEGGLWRVTIDHAGGWRTEYEGLAEVAVASYQLVETGQLIGRAVSGGDWGVGFAVRQGEAAVNPVSLMGPNVVPVTGP